MVGPLNVRAAPMAGTLIGRRHSQESVNAAYLEEHRRVGQHRRLHWLPPLPTDGHHALEAALVPLARAEGACGAGSDPADGTGPGAVALADPRRGSLRTTAP
jgi:hypothetical protein